MPSGTIARLLIDKGFGFIRDESGVEHFFHRSSVRGAVFELLREGQRVGLFYSSANFDEEVFENPFRFDILRNPNPHLSFGGNGAHYCIGANLARLEVEIMFNTIADKMPDIVRTGDPVRLRHGWINGVKHVPVRYA